jgi:hypothetical protein
MALLVLLISTIGAAMAWGSSGNLQGFNLVIFWFGVQVALLSQGVGMTMIYMTVREWYDYQQRLQISFDVTIDNIEAAGGVETVSSYTAWELSASSPKDVLALALLIHRRQGEKAAHSISELKGDHWLASGDGNMVKLGSLGAAEAERLGGKLAELGLVAGRKSRSAGKWVPTSEAEVIDLIERNWHKVA